MLRLDIWRTEYGDFKFDRLRKAAEISRLKLIMKSESNSITCSHPWITKTARWTTLHSVDLERARGCIWPDAVSVLVPEAHA